VIRRAEARLFQWRGVSRRAEARFYEWRGVSRREEASFFFKWRGVPSREEEGGEFLRVERRISTVGFPEPPPVKGQGRR
jgi:hypothetical protein